jgi:hypothetical protein
MASGADIHQEAVEALPQAIFHHTPCGDGHFLDGKCLLARHLISVEWDDDWEREKS